ncbi:MAG TPA: hypothetical protein VGF55_24565, partial [Gemmataceae bacterium]
MDPTAAVQSGTLAPPRRGPVAFVVQAAVVFLPAAVLALGAAVAPAPNPVLIWLGTGLLAILGVVLMAQPRLTQPSTGLAVIAEYVLAQVWLWYAGVSYQGHWYAHFALGTLLLVPLLLFGAVTLERSGAP